ENGRIFFAPFTSGGLRELSLDENGLSVFQEFNTGFIPEYISAFENKVYYDRGVVFDTITGELDTQHSFSNWTLIDAPRRRVFRLKPPSNGTVLEAYELATGKM